jgi:hypothetical protein
VDLQFALVRGLQLGDFGDDVAGEDPGWSPGGLLSVGEATYFRRPFSRVDALLAEEGGE